MQLGVNGKYITVEQLFDAQGNYRILDNVQAAYAKAPAFRNQLEKEYINIDERVNICFMVFDGSMFNFFPRARKKTMVCAGGKCTDYSGGDSIFIKSGFQLLLQTIAEQKLC